MQTLFWILGILAALAGGGYAGYVLGGKKKKEEIEGKIGRTEDAMKKLVDEAYIRRRKAVYLASRRYSLFLF